MTTGIHGHGVVLAKAADTNFAAVTTFGQIVSLSGPNHSVDAIDISNMGSTGKWREFINGMRDAGELSGDIVYDGSTYASAMKTEFTNPTAYWRVLFNDHTSTSNCSKIVCAGFLTSLGHTIPYDDKVGQSFTLKLTGQPVFTART